MKKLICIVLCVLFVGCATITIDGRPIAEHVYSQRNPSTGLRVDFLFVRYEEVTEGKEKFEWPVYLELNRLEKIPLDTKRISIVLQIVNPHEVEYTLKIFCRMFEINGNIKERYRTLSTSRYPNRIHEINLRTTKNVRLEYFLRLYDRKNDMIMEMGTAKYIIRTGNFLGIY